MEDLLACPDNTIEGWFELHEEQGEDITLRPFAEPSPRDNLFRVTTSHTPRWFFCFPVCFVN
jgi:hypothetical protein